jgi:hypothetical protein
VVPAPGSEKPAGTVILEGKIESVSLGDSAKGDSVRNRDYG